jgi:hypothetical protein
MGDDTNDQGESDVEITGEQMGTNPVSQVDSKSSSSKSSSSKGGRPPDPVREYFTATGAVDPKKRRPPVKCNFCHHPFTASQAETTTLRHHILFTCKKATGAAKQKLQAVMAMQVSGDTAAAAAAAVAAGVQRKKQRQLAIGPFAAGSVDNALADGQIKVAEQHLLRTIVCNNLPFNVSSLSRCSQTYHCMVNAVSQGNIAAAAMTDGLWCLLQLQGCNNFSLLRVATYLNAG